MSAPAKETAETTIGSLHALAEAEGDCRRCPLPALSRRHPSRAGRRTEPAEFMLVGEQPGDKEDLAGKPFVGPAGRILDAALKDAGIRRRGHFRHQRGQAFRA
jgi:uracil-DNA glycosylase